MLLLSKFLQKLLYFATFVFTLSVSYTTSLKIANVANDLQQHIALRTSVAKPTNDVFFIAIDFNVPFGSHITAPEGVGKAMAPSIKLTNCKVLNTSWSKAVPILNKDGSASGYTGYYNNFTVLLEVSVDDITEPVDYDIFYVICDKGCTPYQVKGTLQYDGKLAVPTGQQKINKKIKTDTNNKPVKKVENSKNIQKEFAQKTHKENTVIFYNILIGLLGGLILNVMPCVFPVISIKLLSVAKSAGQLPSLVSKQCLAYSFGTIFMFSSLGLLLCIIHQKLPSVGWGFYMQIPQFNYLLLIMFLLCALHFLDIFKFHVPLPQMRFLRSQKIGVCVKSFGNGIFGAITSAVCAGPFLGLPIGKALIGGTVTDAIVLFVSIGIGLALPFLFIAMSPKYVSRLPKLSEKSLKTFSLILGTLMLLSCAWLISVLIPQLNDATKLMWILITLIIGSVLLYSMQNFVLSKTSRVILAISTIATAMSGYMTASVDRQNKQITWHQYTGTLPNKYPMFLNFTASWCLNCQFNSRLFSDAEVIKRFNKKKIYAIKCDWTNRSDEISELLARFGSVSVPFYVYYPKEKKPVILPTMLTKNNILETLSKETKRA